MLTLLVRFIVPALVRTEYKLSGPLAEASSKPPLCTQSQLLVLPARPAWLRVATPEARNSPPPCTVTCAFNVVPLTFNTAPLDTTIVPLIEPLVAASVPTNASVLVRLIPSRARFEMEPP